MPICAFVLYRTLGTGRKKKYERTKIYFHSKKVKMLRKKRWNIENNIKIQFKKRPRQPEHHTFRIKQHNQLSCVLWYDKSPSELSAGATIHTLHLSITRYPPDLNLITYCRWPSFWGDAVFSTISPKSQNCVSSGKNQMVKWANFYLIWTVLIFEAPHVKLFSLLKQYWAPAAPHPFWGDRCKATTLPPALTSSDDPLY